MIGDDRGWLLCPYVHAWMPNHMTVLASIGHGVWKVLRGKWIEDKRCMDDLASRPAGVVIITTLSPHATRNRT
jgi:hypothetical protein